jgi:excisionase family DNA binding protein
MLSVSVTTEDVVSTRGLKMSAGAMTQQEFYTVKEVASILRVTPRTIWKMINSGELAAIKVRDEYRIAQQSLDAFIEGQKPKQTEG